MLLPYTPWFAALFHGAQCPLTTLPPSLPPVPAGANGLMTVLFSIDGEIGNKKEYYVDALLLKDAKDYKS
jgi:hypothetical protein